MRSSSKSGGAGTRAVLLYLSAVALPACAVWIWSSLEQRKEASSVGRSIQAPSLWREDPSLTGGVDEPSEGSTVRGTLEVRGWARIPDQDLRVIVFIDGKERPFAASARLERRDVQRALPLLGDCATAGYEFKYAFSREGPGAHEIEVLFRTLDGRERHYPVRWFVWAP
jgi:hypothetical protein